MSERVDGFDRRELLGLFEDLAERLGRRRARAVVYVVDVSEVPSTGLSEAGVERGRAAIAMLYDAERVTRDIDSLILEGHGELTDAVREIARERGLPSTWLNEQASVYVSRAADAGQSRVFDHPNLSIAAASPRHLLAMKVEAARASDVGDIRSLLAVLDLTSVDAVEEVLEQVFPGSMLKPGARFIIEDLLAERNQA